MLDHLRNQERLDPSVEDRIDRNTRIIILAMTAVVVAVILWAVFTKKPFGIWYYAVILVLLAIVWLIKCVISAFPKHALAQRTDEQVSAYLKAAGLELAAYVGLGWFLVGMQGNGIFGAVVYLIGITGARKQREIYYQEPGEETEEDGSPDQPDGPSDQTDEDILDGDVKVISESVSPSEPGSLPSAADRLLREKEQEDGSV